MTTADTLTGAQIGLVRLHILGRKRRTAGDRAVLRDCDAADRGHRASRELVARLYMGLTYVELLIPPDIIAAIDDYNARCDIDESAKHDDAAEIGRRIAEIRKVSK